jgi:hypothetical protein
VLAVRELTWGFLTHSAFDLGRPITLAPVGALDPAISNSVEGRFCQALKGGDGASREARRLARVAVVHQRFYVSRGRRR